MFDTKVYTRVDQHRGFEFNYVECDCQNGGSDCTWIAKRADRITSLEAELIASHIQVEAWRYAAKAMESERDTALRTKEKTIE